MKKKLQHFRTLMPKIKIVLNVNRNKTNVVKKFKCL